MRTRSLGRGAPFIAVAGLSALVWGLAWLRLPHVRGHLSAPRRHPLTEFAAVAREPSHLWGFVFTFFLVLGTFTVGSFVAPVFCATNGWGENEMAVIYLVAGLCTLVATNLAGRLADRFDRLPLFRRFGGVTLVMAVVITNLPAVPVWVAAVAVSGFMGFAAVRMVPAQAMLLTEVEAVAAS